MKRIQKRAHGRVNGLANINGGLHALRCALLARMPSDFECWFCDNGREVLAGFEWLENGYGNEVHASDVGKLLQEWQGIDWQAARMAALHSARLLAADARGTTQATAPNPTHKGRGAEAQPVAVEVVGA